MAYKVKLADEVRIYLLGDRQWKREHREQHAQFKLDTATTPEDKTFWRAILDAVRLPRLAPRKVAR